MPGEGVMPLCPFLPTLISHDAVPPEVLEHPWWGRGIQLCSSLHWVLWPSSLKPGQPYSSASPSGSCLITTYSTQIFSLPLQCTWTPVLIFPRPIQASS